MKKTYIIVLIVIISALFGYLLGAFQYKNELNKAKTEYSDLKRNLDQFFPQPPKEIFSVSGVVKSVSNGKIYLQINAFPKSSYPWDQRDAVDKKDERVVSVTKDTKMIKRIYLSEPPLRGGNGYEDKSLNIEELKEGDVITLKSFENLKENKNVTAKEIMIVDLGDDLNNM